MRKPTEIEAKNILIAEFMGLKIYNDTISFFDSTFKPLKKYHEDWNYLMEVVIKCFDIQEDMNSDDLYFKLNDALLETNLDSLHKAVVEIINDYTGKAV